MNKNRKSPTREHGEKLSSILLELCRAIHKESGASGVKVVCVFNFRVDEKAPLGKGVLKMKTFTTPDAKTERMNPDEIQEPRGSKLQRDAMANLRHQVERLCRKQGGR